MTCDVHGRVLDFSSAIPNVISLRSTHVTDPAIAKVFAEIRPKNSIAHIVRTPWHVQEFAAEFDLFCGDGPLMQVNVSAL